MRTRHASPIYVEAAEEAIVDLVSGKDAKLHGRPTRKQFMTDDTRVSGDMAQATAVEI